MYIILDLNFFILEFQFNWFNVQFYITNKRLKLNNLIITYLYCGCNLYANFNRKQSFKILTLYSTVQYSIIYIYIYLICVLTALLHVHALLQTVYGLVYNTIYLEKLQLPYNYTCSKQGQKYWKRPLYGNVFVKITLQLVN